MNSLLSCMSFIDDLSMDNVFTLQVYCKRTRVSNAKSRVGRKVTHLLKESERQTQFLDYNMNKEKEKNKKKKTY